MGELLRVRFLVRRRCSAALLFGALLSCLYACGDDDSGKGPGSDAGLLRDAGGVDAGDAGAGMGTEGFPCRAAGDCNSGLACVLNIFVDQSGRDIGVCARSCENDPDCNTDEVCFGYTNASADRHCVNVVNDEYGLCGVGDTSICRSDRSCLYFPDSAVGVCIDTCAVNGGDESDGGTEDAGTSAIPQGAVMCQSGETCIDGVLASPMDNEGVCGTLVRRGGECGLEMGKYCDEGDICAPEDPSDLSSTPRCFEDCTSSGTCESGDCVIVQQQFGYCM